MATAGRIVAALASGTQETTIALAQLNFDFSLIKLEAPASFQGVGQLLSRNRKASAESGSTHVTARKLGALFEQVIPSTPRLIDRYGSRASEITQLSENEEASNPIYGMFADQAGVDATSVWAAATSGPAAIAVHLLACMLARMFSGPEATSIWAELIDERKKVLATEDEYKPGYLSTLLAAQISIPREQLAAWDNSARSWLRVADSAKNKQQTQLLLVIKNIHLPVNSEVGNLYHNVTTAWVRALTLMENLCGGIAQCITPYEGNGELLLALSSWHIYPDMDALGSTMIHQKDPLIPKEAILSVGLECSPAQQDIGVYWSLPLSHFRFYGPPKTASRSLCTDSERVPFDQFRFVLLGCFLSNWNTSSLLKLEISESLKLIVALYTYLTQVPERPVLAEAGISSAIKVSRMLTSQPNWLRDLSESCRILLRAKGSEKVIYDRLVGLGIRRGPRFLSNQPDLFGLSSFKDLFDMLVGTEAKILALRKLAIREGISSPDVLIRYRNPNYDEEGKGTRKRTRGDLDETLTNPLFGEKAEYFFRNAGPPVKRRAPLEDQAPIFPFVERMDEDEELSGELDLYASPQSYTTRGVDFERLVEHDSRDHFAVLTNDPEGTCEDPTSLGYLHDADEGTLHKNTMQSEQEPDWPDGILYDPYRVDSVNTTEAKKSLLHLPPNYYIYASAMPFDKLSMKTPTEPGDDLELKNVPYSRWVSADERQLFAQNFTNENILDTISLELANSSDESIWSGSTVPLHLVLGDSTECALFTSDKSCVLKTSPKDILWALEDGVIDRIKLANFLFVDSSSVQGAFVWNKQQLECTALTLVGRTYVQFLKATVALKVIEEPLRGQLWVKSLEHQPRRGPGGDGADHCLAPECEPEAGSGEERAVANESTTTSKRSVNYGTDVAQKLSKLLSITTTRSECFALLATFETGILNPNPLGLVSVMAMSSGDSIFVAAHLLVDPWDSHSLNNSSICRIRGNIGKPGVAMMVSPPELQMRQRDSASWQVINHAEFDNKMTDSFRGTSLHLSFTKYDRPADVGTHGIMDAELYFVEAYVQVRCKGRWIGDIDIISGLESEYLQIYFAPSKQDQTSGCRHTGPNTRTFRSIAIDNWDEFIDSPSHAMVVRAKDNWLARVAAANLSAQRQFKTVVLKSADRVCWPCVSDTCELGTSLKGTTFVC